MNVVIAGGGRVGFHLAHLLSAAKQNVTVIEANAGRVEQIDYALDVSTVTGDASSVLLLQVSDVGGADLFVASMGNDEVNLIAAATAKGLGAKKVVARVDNPMYIDSNILYESVLGVDYILSPDALAALEIARYVEHPGLLAAEEFGRGLVQMRHLQVSQSPMKDGKTLKDILPPGSGVLLGIINRGGESIIPHGDSVVEDGDQVTLIGHRDKMEAVESLFCAGAGTVQRVAIMGGGVTGLRLAQALEGKMKSVKIFERREDRCAGLAAKLKKAKVVFRDAGSRIALTQEHMDKVDIFVAATSDDERNIMASVLAKEVGARSVAAVVHQPDFAPLVSRLGIDLAITPRAAVSNRILRLLHPEGVTALAVLAEGQVEVIEFEVGDGSPLLGQCIADCRNKFPRGALIATILRGDQVIVPGGEDEIHAGDSIILIASAETLEDARKLLGKQR
jgi:trk system potassium uptake protein